MPTELVSVLACPRCKGGLQSSAGGLLCAPCDVVYPVRDDVPILLVEEAIPAKGRAEEGAGPVGPSVSFRIVEGKNTGEVIELVKGTCRAVGRSLEDSEQTRVVAVQSTIALDDSHKKVVMNYITRQAKKKGGGEYGGFQRAPDIYLRDGATSRLHAMLFFDDSGVGILDLVSKNGTFVNGVEVESKLLKKGDLVLIGGTKFRVE